MKPISIQDILQLMEKLDALLAERERLPEQENVLVKGLAIAYKIE